MRGPRHFVLLMLVLWTALFVQSSFFERPEFTEKYEGFFHLFQFEGTVEKATMAYIIRDHDHEKFLEKKSLMLERT